MVNFRIESGECRKYEENSSIIVNINWKNFTQMYSLKLNVMPSQSSILFY